MKAIITIDKNRDGEYYAMLKTGLVNEVVTGYKIWYSDVREAVEIVAKALVVLGYEVEVIDKPHRKYLESKEG